MKSGFLPKAATSMSFMKSCPPVFESPARGGISVAQGKEHSDATLGKGIKNFSA